MVLTNHSFAQAESGFGAAQYHFISIEAPGGAKDQTTRRAARSHAVKRALENKRKLQQKSMDNFRVTTARDTYKRFVTKKTRTQTPTVSVASLSADVLDPFQSLAVDSSRLQTLLTHYKARQAPEPVFSVAEELAFQNFRSVFRTGLVDPALLNAVMLSFVLAETGGSINQECLRYKGQAMGYIRERMNSPCEATSESTIGAILLLAGVEARLGIRSHVQLHMGAVQLLLEICQTEGIHLTDGIKRAIFWQDLNSSILVGSSRIVDHTTFAELYWERDPSFPHFSRLPLGFQKRAHLFSKELIGVLEDIYALQCIRETPRSTKSDVKLMAHINNHTASIQSRLASLSNSSPLLECCHLAAYLCSVMLCCKVWCALVIPSHVSLQLLLKLQQANDDPIWNDHPDLLLWLIYVGGAFAPTGLVCSDYVTLLRSNVAGRFGALYRSWPEVLEIMKQFTWSDKAFLSQVKAFWKTVSNQYYLLAPSLGV